MVLGQGVGSKTLVVGRRAQGVGRRGIQSQTLLKIRNKEKIKYANNDAVRRPFSGDRIHEFLVLKLQENL